MTNEKSNPDRLHIFTCSTGHSSHWNAPEPLKVKMFLHQTKLRSHSVKHFANSYEVNEWKGLAEFDQNEITVSIDAIKEAGCPYFTQKTDTPPCWQQGRQCKKYETCSKPAQFLEKTYEQCIVEAIRAGIIIPRNVCFDRNHYEKIVEDYWAVPDVPVVVKMYRQQDRYTVATCFRPGAGTNVTRSEGLDNLSRKIFNNALHNSIIWCTEETWKTPIRPDRRKGKKLPGKSKKQYVGKKAGRNRPRKKERGGSRNLTTSYSWDDDE